MRALGYFTFDPKARHGAHSYQGQYARFRDFCRDNRHTHARVFADPYGEEGLDGWRDLVNFIRDAVVGYLVVVPDARVLGAEIEQQVARVLEMDALSSRVVCSDPQYPDPLQNALRGGHAGAGRRQRIREGMMAKAAKGLGLGKPPYGYRIQADGAFRTVPEEADVVRLIFGEYLGSGGGVRSVAAVLNERGLATRAGRPWSMVAVRDILRNAAYIGTYRRFGLRIPGAYEPIISGDDFRRAQERLSERSPLRQSRRQPPFMLSGLIFCGHCGRGMIGVTRRQSWRRKDGERARAEYRYYQCQSRINRNECDYHTIRAEETEERVALEAREQLLLPERDGKHRAWTDRAHAESSARIRVLDRRFMEGVQRAAHGKLTLGQLRAGAARLRSARDALTMRVEMTSADASAKALFEDDVARLIDEWTGLSGEERRELLRSLVKRVTVKEDGIEVALA